MPCGFQGEDAAKAAESCFSVKLWGHTCSERALGVSGFQRGPGDSTFLVTQFGLESLPW